MSIKLCRVDRDASLLQYAGVYGNPFWGDPSFIIFSGGQITDLGSIDLGYINTSKHFGYSDTACDHLGADGLVTVFPDDVNLSTDVEIDPWTGQTVEKINIDYPVKKGRNTLGNIITTICLDFKSFHSRWVASYSDYCSDDWSHVVGKAPRYAGAIKKGRILTLYFPGGFFERFTLVGKASWRRSGWGECIYTTKLDMETQFPSSEGYTWEGLYRCINYDTAPGGLDQPTQPIEWNLSFAYTKNEFSSSLSELEDYRHQVVERAKSIDGLDAFNYTDLLRKEYLSWYSLDNIRYLSVNSIAFLRDLMTLKDTLVPLLRLIREPMSPQAWANAWLSLRYGIRLTIMDLGQIIKAYDQWKKMPTRPFSTIRSRFTDESTLLDGDPITLQVHQKVYYGSTPDVIDNIIDSLRKWDLFPSLENMWDLVPYSFVVDWFVNVTDVLKQIDLDVDLDRLPIQYVLYSSKIELKEGKPSTSGHVLRQSTVKYYRRWSESTLSSPVKPPDRELSANLPIRVLDGLSLMIQRIKSR